MSCPGRRTSPAFRCGSDRPRPWSRVDPGHHAHDAMGLRPITGPVRELDRDAEIEPGPRSGTLHDERGDLAPQDARGGAVRRDAQTVHALEGGDADLRVLKPRRKGDLRLFKSRRRTSGACKQRKGKGRVSPDRHERVLLRRGCGATVWRQSCDRGLCKGRPPPSMRMPRREPPSGAHPPRLWELQRFRWIA